jgi:GTP:adenosylcobinamide-phosphate guanylyltransferase
VRVDAVVLGGGDGAVIDPGSRFKGLAMVGGRPLIEHVVGALREAELVNGVAAVVPSAEDLGAWADSVDKLVVSQGGFMDNVIAGIESFRVDRPVLVTTGDLPLLDGAALDDYIRSSLATGADLTYPVIRKEDILAAFPGTERTYIKLASGSVTGGNMAILNPALARGARELGERLFAARKSPLAMARILGMRFVVRLVTGRLDVPELEAKLGELVGGTGAAVFTRHASIGLDVDKPADVTFVEGVLGGPGGVRGA